METIPYELAVKLGGAMVTAIGALAAALVWAVKWARSEQSKRDEIHTEHLEFAKSAITVIEQNNATRTAAREAHERRERASEEWRRNVDAALGRIAQAVAS